LKTIIQHYKLISLIMDTIVANKIDDFQINSMTSILINQNLKGVLNYYFHALKIRDC